MHNNDNNNAVKISTAPRNPAYTDTTAVWDIINDCVLGEDAIKDNGEIYLPKTTGMKADPIYGQLAYDNYKKKALYPAYPYNFLLQLNGLLWQREPQVNVPDEMDTEFLPSPAFATNKSFMDVYHETSDAVLKLGRHGILLDVPSNGKKSIKTYPVLVQYGAYQIKHWGYDSYKGQQVVKFVLLDESSLSYENASLSQETKQRYRFLGLCTRDEMGNELEKPVYYSYVMEGSFRKAIFDPPFTGESVIEYEGETIVFPNINGKFMDTIPFFCFGVTNMTLDIENSVIYPLCKYSLAIYRMDADYKEYLFKNGFSILFGKGFNSKDDIYVGTQKAIIVDSESADLKYVNVDGTGLAEYRLALENLHKNANEIGINLLKTSGDESGVSVQKHATFKTASLKSIAKTLAYGFTCICKLSAEWRGLGKTEIDNIIVVPNLEFSTSGGDTTSLMNMYGVYAGEKPILTDFDYYSWLRKNDFTSESYETWQQKMDEMKKLKEEEARKLLDQEAKRLEQKSILQSKNTLKGSQEIDTPIAKEVSPVEKPIIDNRAKQEG